MCRSQDVRLTYIIGPIGLTQSQERPRLINAQPLTRCFGILRGCPLRLTHPTGLGIQATSQLTKRIDNPGRISLGEPLQCRDNLEEPHHNLNKDSRLAADLGFNLNPYGLTNFSLGCRNSRWHSCIPSRHITQPCNFLRGMIGQNVLSIPRWEWCNMSHDE